jgi:quercetin dioxygenase-like cupin family protein
MSSRKQFIGQSSIGLLTLLASPLLASGNTLTGNTPTNFEGVVVHEEEGEAYQVKGGRGLLKIKVAKIQGAESMCFLTEDFPPGEAISIHKHLWDDEFIFLHRGSGLFTLGTKEVMIKEGAFAFVPKGVWHGLQNTGNVNIEMRFGYCPSGMENFFRETGVPVGQPYIRKPFEERKAIAKRYGFVPKVEPTQ